MAVYVRGPYQVLDTAQTYTIISEACGCEEWRYSLPGHSDAVHEFLCDTHNRSLLDGPGYYLVDQDTSESFWISFDC